jgi:glutamyl-Q tRNA(Asp) synthetase
MPERYIGRFAPSPTGPLHFGSLLAAVASYLDARASGGLWLVRMEDIDPPREVAGAADTILRQLEAHGLQWDRQVLFQSERQPAYAAIVDDWLSRDMAYCCACSRKDVRAMGGIYDGRCRHRHIAREGNAVRVWVPPNTSIRFDDLFQGRQWQVLDSEVGDFIIRRRDGLFAYQLAAAADDLHQGITHVIRGSDLLDSTPRQIFLLRLLGANAPVYGHIPVAVNPGGQKLSKQTLALSIDHRDPARNLLQALAWLGVPVEPALAGAGPGDILEGARQLWSPRCVPVSLSRPAPSGWA